MRYYPLTEDRIKKWKAEGRGSGTKDTWNPWLHRTDFPSKGKQTVDPVFAQGREMHFLSYLERNFYLIYRLSADVDWIQEQVNWDREESRKIAKELGIKHPRDPGSQTDIVMTTDLVVHKLESKSGQRTLFRSVKPGRELMDHNQMEHAEIERRLCERHGGSLIFMTESSLGPPCLLRNADKLYMHRDLDRRPFALSFPGALESVSAEVTGEILHAQSSNYRLYEFTTQLNDQRGWPRGTAASVALFLIDQHKLAVNPTRHLLDDYPISEIAALTAFRSSQKLVARAA